VCAIQSKAGLTGKIMDSMGLAALYVMIMPRLCYLGLCIMRMPDAGLPLKIQQFCFDTLITVLFMCKRGSRA
jgi:hypothetical protein